MYSIFNMNFSTSVILLYLGLLDSNLTKHLALLADFKYDLFITPYGFLFDQPILGSRSLLNTDWRY